MPNLSSDYHEIPRNCFPYDYDNPGPPFSPETIAAVDSIKEFLSEAELAQARRLETLFFSPIFGRGVGTAIPGLRSYSTSACLYATRYNDLYYEDLLQGFVDRVPDGCPQESPDGIHWAWFRVTTPDGNRHYPLKFHGNIQAWKDRITAAANDVRTTLGSFDRGKFCLTDGQRFAFGELTIDRLEGGKPIPKDW